MRDFKVKEEKDDSGIVWFAVSFCMWALLAIAILNHLIQ